MLARGASGNVVEAIDRDGGPIAVAIKLLRADGPGADIAGAMFRREVEALEGLNHEGIVRILDWFHDENGLLGIVLELVPGGHTLRSNCSSAHHASRPTSMDSRCTRRRCSACRSLMRISSPLGWMTSSRRF
jgi:serine/threonine protein kinase